MGVLNATPDSFYAGSRANTLEQGLEKAERLIREGADVLDIGGESTRPGAAEVSTEAELGRVIPLVTEIRTRWPQMALSIDTQKAGIARQCLEQGVCLINDVSALRTDPEMADVVAAFNACVVLMHMQGTPRTMQESPAYTNVIDDIKRFFEERLAYAVKHGIRREHILLDPGIGFGKTVEHNLEILRRLRELAGFGCPLLLGVSRKSFIGGFGALKEERLGPDDRLEGTLAAELWAADQGVAGVRVHDVAATRRALAVWKALHA